MGREEEVRISASVRIRYESCMRVSHGERPFPRESRINISQEALESAI